MKKCRNFIAISSLHHHDPRSSLLLQVKRPTRVDDKVDAYDSIISQALFAVKQLETIHITTLHSLKLIRGWESSLTLVWMLCLRRWRWFVKEMTTSLCGDERALILCSSSRETLVSCLPGSFEENFFCEICHLPREELIIVNMEFLQSVSKSICPQTHTLIRLVPIDIVCRSLSLSLSSIRRECKYLSATLSWLYQALWWWFYSDPISLL
jgi:hypothetical protein